MTVETTSDGQTFTFPMNATGGTVDCTIDWGDGNTSTITAYNDADLVHTYATAGRHQFVLRGSWTAPYFANAGDRLLLKSVDQWGTGYGTNWYLAFRGCTNLTSLPTGAFGAGIINLSYAFESCNFPGNASISNWDITSLQLGTRAFGYNVNFNTSIRWNLPVCTDLSSLFQNCTSFNQDISGLQIPSVTTLHAFLTSANAFSQANYDLLLISLHAQGLAGNLQPNVPFGGPPCHYTAGGAAQAAHDYLTGTLGWTITDGGPA
jgi:hypothetical protein